MCPQWHSSTLPRWAGKGLTFGSYSSMGRALASGAAEPISSPLVAQSSI
jgi:hypothetical protein